MATLQELNEQIFILADRIMELVKDEDTAEIHPALPGTYFDALIYIWQETQDIHTDVPHDHPLWLIDE